MLVGLRRSLASRYDSFWKPRLSAIAGGIGAVADGAGAQIIDVSGLTEYGRRPRAPRRAGARCRAACPRPAAVFVGSARPAERAAAAIAAAEV